MNTIKYATLIFFIGSYCQFAFAGYPIGVSELNTPQIQAQPEKKPLPVQKPVTNLRLSNFNAPNIRSLISNTPLFYKPVKQKESSDWVNLRTNIGHVLNLSHMIYTDITDINIPCTSYTSADRLANTFPNPEIRKRDIRLVSAISALSVSGLILAPIINCITGSLRYNNNARGSYAISLDMDNGLGLVARF